MISPVVLSISISVTPTARLAITLTLVKPAPGIEGRTIELFQLLREAKESGERLK
jgi:hypothetical protein